MSANRDQTRVALKNIDEIAKAYQAASAQIGAASAQLIDAQSAGDDSEDLVAFARAVTEARDKLLNCERALAEYLLHRRGIRQREAAELMGIGRATISRWSQTPEYFDRVTIRSATSSINE